jgi:hypothetical protein
MSASAPSSASSPGKTPISGLVSSERQHPRLPEQPVSNSNTRMPWLSAFVSSRLRLRRIAPDTHHQDQASGNNNRCLSPWWLRHPRRTTWYRNASNGLHKFAGCRRVGANLWLAAHCRRSALTACRGRRHDIPFKFPELEPSLPTGLAGRRRELHAKQRVISKSLRSFRMKSSFRRPAGPVRPQSEAACLRANTSAHLNALSARGAVHRAQDFDKSAQKPGRSVTRLRLCLVVLPDGATAAACFSGRFRNNSSR